jgi:hypothetical protein
MYDSHESCKGATMQISVDVNEELMKKAMRLSGLPTQEAVIEEGLRMVICTSDHTLEDLAGVFPLDIDLDKSRRD